MLEYEKKFALSKEEYETLSHIYADHPIKSQINFYYDTEDGFYNSKGITCRIRGKNGLYEATVKSHSSLDFSDEKTIAVRDGFDSSVFMGMNVILHGCMYTDRKEIILPTGIRMALDKNTYLETVDYELEMEYPPTLKPLCDDLLQSLISKLHKNDFDRALCDFQRRVRNSTKSERFFARKKALQGGEFYDFRS